MKIDSYIAALANDHALRWLWSIAPPLDCLPRRADVRRRRDVRVRDPRFKKFV